MSATSPVRLIRRALAALVKNSTEPKLAQLKIFANVPHDASFPYATWADVQSRFLSSDDPKTLEIIQNLSVWAMPADLALCQDIGWLLVSLCDDVSLNLLPYQFSSLRLVSSDTKRTANGRYINVTLRLRIVIDVIKN
jgi:hypothetical protein